MIRLLFSVVAFCSFYSTTLAQDSALTAEYKEQVIQKLNDLIQERYVFPDIAKETGEHLLQQLEAGHFNSYENNTAFAEALTSAVQSINNDKHMRIRANPTYESAPNSPEYQTETQIARIDRSRQGNYGFNSVQILEGNVGYIDLRGFAGLENAKAHADAAMQLLQRTDAIIFDLRKNGGGSPRMVQYLCSFFFNQRTHLNSLYWREGDRTEEFWTLDNIGGKRMPDVPLFVITSDYTFSGAEEFSYNMQTQKRATLIGEITGGGANPGGMIPINENLRVFIPTGTAINPITNTNWEGIGVHPDIETSAEEAHNKTLELAQAAAKEFRLARKVRFTTMLTELRTELENYNPENSEEHILQKLTECQKTGLMREGDINRLGYEQLLEHKQNDIAEAVFRANTLLYPNSANVFDSYGEALMISGKLKASAESFQQAVDLAIKNEDGNLAYFQRNLATVKERLEKED